VRDSLRWLLESVSLPVETFGSAADFLHACDPHCHGCLILDIRMPDISGLQLQTSWLNAAFGCHHHVERHGDVRTAVRVVKRRRDFIEKPYNGQELLDRFTASATDARRHRKSRNMAICKRIGSLTPREREVLDWVVSGTPISGSPPNLHQHQDSGGPPRSRHEKMAAKSVAELTAMRIICGLH